MIRATLQIWYLQNVDANDIGLYQTTVTGTCGTVKSDKVYVYVKKEDYSGDPEVFVWPTMVTGEFRIALSNDKNYTILLSQYYRKAFKEKRELPVPDDNEHQ